MSNVVRFQPPTQAIGEKAAVSCRQVTKEFGSGGNCVQALNGVDFEAYPGEITLLVGPSGCGKTTLLCVIGGLLNKTAGHIDVLGTNPEQLKGSASVVFRRKNLG